MKKIFYGIETILILSTLTSLICYSVFAKTWLSTMLTILIFALAFINFVYVLTKNKKNIISSSLIIASIIFAIVANAFIVKIPNLFLTMMILSEIALIVSLFFNTKFSTTDIFYILAITIPFLLLVNLAPVFGYSGPINRILISLLTVSITSVFGISISNLIKKKTAFNTAFSIVAFLNLVVCLGLIIHKQSTLSHRVTPIINICFYALLFLFSAVIVLINTNFDRPAINLKRSLICSINIMLVALIVGYTFISNCLAFNLFTAKIYKDQFFDMVGNNLNIPVIEIYTQDNEIPKSKEEYVNCSFEISNCDNDKFNFSVPMAKKYEDDGCVGIRLRGNSTRKARKQPYRIKFDKKQSFFNLEPNKSWVLLADYFDQSYIRNYTAFTLADSFDNLNFTPTPHHVALLINDEFKGLYLLCEQIDEKKGRTNVDEDFDVEVDKEFPFLAELDFYARNEGITGIDNFYVDAVDNYVEIKYPESDERQKTETSDKAYDYIYEYINAVFTSLMTGEKVDVSFRDNPVGFEDLVDIDSLVDYYLLNEIMLNPDNSYKSIYLHKDKDGLMQFGPIWDFDYSMSIAWDVPYDQSHIEDANVLRLARSSGIYNTFLKNETYYNKVATRYNQIKDCITQTSDKLKTYKSTIDAVAIIDAEMWHGTTGEFQFDMQYDYVRLFLQDRYAFLNTIFSMSHAEFLELL